MTKKTKRLLFHIFQIIVSVGLIVYIIHKAEPSKVLDTFRDIEIKYYLFFLGVALIATFLMVTRWYILINSVLEQRIGSLRLLQFTMIGFFFNLAMPTAVGGDLVKAYLAGKHSGELEKGSMSALVDRLLGVITIFTIGVISSLVSLKTLNDKKLLAVILIAFAIFITGLILLFTRKLIKYVSRLFDLIKLTKLKGFLKQFYEAIYMYRGQKAALVKALIISIILQVMNITALFVLSRGVGMEVQFSYFLIFVPLIYVIQMLPISISGIGVRENAFVFFFGLAGVKEEVALSLSLLYFSMFIIFGLAGSVVTMLSKFNYHKIEESQ